MIQILHNPRCGKSREGLAILEASGKEFEVIKYLENNPSKKQLKEIIRKLNVEPLKLVRQNETIWKENFKNKDLSDDQIIDAMVANPILIERPIVINGNKAIIGRPPLEISTII
ncbi:arsenate reductase [Flavobacterium arsenatis]|uniref:Arsenate reductase n=1 Tax=Flavobacterium arsenatis TaxID=1484332 RepID=A0ABU1TTA3_9FLAO|nr:arsenate reductase (glutaredoxin) [Flavobacterium arsenatis]MDR6969098.1 arsenate reductase [Flavobacterium arsenatis]